MWDDIVLNAVHRWVRSPVSCWKAKRWTPLHLLWDSSNKAHRAWSWWRGGGEVGLRWAGPLHLPERHRPPTHLTCEVLDFSLPAPPHPSCDAWCLHHAPQAEVPSSGHCLSLLWGRPAPPWCRANTSWPAHLSSPVFHVLVLCLACDALVFCGQPEGSLFSAFAQSFFCLEGPNPLLPQTGPSHFKVLLHTATPTGCLCAFAAHIPTGSLFVFTFCSGHLLPATRPWDAVAAPNVHFATLFENVQFCCRRKQMKWVKLINMC